MGGSVTKCDSRAGHLSATIFVRDPGDRVCSGETECPGSGLRGASVVICLLLTRT